VRKENEEAQNSLYFANVLPHMIIYDVPEKEGREMKWKE